MRDRSGKIISLSKSRKIKYSCPNCKESHLQRAIMYGQNSFSCPDCMTFGPWRSRIKSKHVEN